MSVEPDFQIELRNAGAPTFIDRLRLVSGSNPGLAFLVDSPFILDSGETRTLRLQASSSSSFTTTVAAGNAARDLVQFTLSR